MPNTAMEICKPPEGWDPHCGPCLEHFRSPGQQHCAAMQYSARATDEKADNILQQMIEVANTNRESVKSKLQTHGDLILSRWSKKSREKRAVLLATAAPRVFGQWPKTSQLPCDEFGTPLANKETGSWLEIEGLSSNKNDLFSLLHLRTAYSPESWSAFDTRAALRCWSEWFPCNFFNEKCVVIFGEQYGQLVPYNHDRTHVWSIIGFPRATLTLRAQALVMLTLNRVVDALIGDKPPSGSTKWSLSTAGDMRPATSEIILGGFEYEEFVPPIRFDPRAAFKKAQARHRMALDDAECLQSDPEYMRRIAMLRLSSNLYEKERSPRSIDGWSKVAVDLVLDITQRLDGWRMLLESSMHAKEICERYGNELSPAGDIPEDASNALKSLCRDVEIETLIQTDVVIRLLPSLLPTRTEFHKGTASQQQQRRVTATELSRAVKELEMLLRLSKPSGITSCFYERLRKHSKSLVLDEHFVQQLDELTAVDGIRLACSWHQLNFPQFDVVDFLGMSSKHADGRLGQSIMSGEHLRVSARPELEVKTFGKLAGQGLGRALQRFCDAALPSGRMDMTWLAKSTESRARLADFWRAVRELVPKLAKHYKCEPKEVASLEDAFSFAYFDQSEEYAAEIEREKLECESKQRAVDKSVKLTAKDSSDNTDTTTVAWQTTASDAPQRRKCTKAKAARLAGSASSDSGGPTPSDDSPPQHKVIDRQTQVPRKLILVKQDTLRILDLMYSKTGQSAKACIRWTDFVKALLDTGFTQEGCTGSAFTFNSPEGSIAFHKPHPNPVVDPYMLRSMGKRLHKWFG